MIALSDLRAHITQWADTTRSLEDVEWWVDFAEAWGRLPKLSQRDVGRMLWGEKLPPSRTERLEQALLKELNRPCE